MTVVVVSGLKRLRLEEVFLLLYFQIDFISSFISFAEQNIFTSVVIVTQVLASCSLTVICFVCVHQSTI